MRPINACDTSKLQQMTVADSARRLEQCKPAAPETTQKSPELHPWLKNTFAGTAVGALAGAGTALTVSSFLDDPLMTVHKSKIGGIQGAVAGTVGAFVAYWAPDRASGTALGAIAGAGTAAAQAIGAGGDKVQVITSALSGLAAGAAAGNLSVMLRDHKQATKAISEASLSD